MVTNTIPSDITSNAFNLFVFLVLLSCLETQQTRKCDYTLPAKQPRPLDNILAPPLDYILAPPIDNIPAP